MGFLRRIEAGVRGGPARNVGIAAIAAGGLDLLFWLRYATSSAPLDPAVRAYEGAFPIADAILGLALLLAGGALIRGSSLGEFLLVAAAGASLYLGVVDVTFYAKRAAYARPGAEATVEILVNVASLGGGLFGLADGWIRWRERKETSPWRR
jgi:hypothetical protein